MSTHSSSILMHSWLTGFPQNHCGRALWGRAACLPSKRAVALLDGMLWQRLGRPLNPSCVLDKNLGLGFLVKRKFNRSPLFCT